MRVGEPVPSAALLTADEAWQRWSSAKPTDLGTSSDALMSWQMTDEKQWTRREKQDQERADRDHDRSEEAHWRVAETGAEEEERESKAARPTGTQEDDWENEGVALEREPEQTTE
jgi:hypothetical protein